MTVASVGAWRVVSPTCPCYDSATILETQAAVGSFDTGLSAADARLALIDALYAVADDNGDWSTLIDAVARLPEMFGQDDADAAAMIARHAERAADAARARSLLRQGDGERRWDAILVGADLRFRQAIGEALQQVRPFLFAPPDEGSPLRFLSSIHDNVTQSVRLARLSGIAALKLSAGPDARLTGLVLSREAFPAGLAQAFGIDPSGIEPLFALLPLSAAEAPQSVKALARAWGLTAAESRLVDRIRQGDAIGDAAQALNISRNTARTQLQSIFAKSGVNRQVELVQLITGAGGIVRAPTLGATPRVEAPQREMLRLQDGRRLYFRLYGPAHGKPVLYFHSAFGSSLVGSTLRTAMQAAGLRVAAFDRPGYGQSDPVKAVSFRDAAADAEQLADHLGFAKVALAGSAIGAGYAVATAERFGSRAVRLGLIGPRLPSPRLRDSKSSFAEILRRPWAIRALTLLLQGRMSRRMVHAACLHYVRASPSDRALFKDPRFVDEVFAAGVDAFERGIGGCLADIDAAGRAFDFSVTKLTMPVAIWHGAENGVQSTAAVVEAFGGFPRCEIHLVPEAGVYLHAQAYAEFCAFLALR